MSTSVATTFVLIVLARIFTKQIGNSKPGERLARRFWNRYSSAGSSDVEAVASVQGVGILTTGFWASGLGKSL